MTINDFKKMELEKEIRSYIDDTLITLSQNQIQEIVSLRKEGSSIAQIAWKLKVKHYVVRNILKKELAIEQMDQGKRRCLDLPAKLFRIFNQVCTQVEQEEELIPFGEYCIKTAMEVYHNIKPYTKYRNYNELMPIVMYLTLKLKGIPLHIGLLFSKGIMSKKEFNKGMRCITPLLSDYHNRDKKAVVSRFLVNLARKFKFGNEFERYAQKALIYFYNDLSNLKEQVIVSILCYMSLLLTNNSPKFITAICEYLGIATCSLYPTFNRFLQYTPDPSNHKGIISSQEKIKEWLESLFT